MRVYNLYYQGQQINTKPLTKADVEVIRQHNEVSIIRKRQATTIPLSDIKIVERIII